MLVDRNHVRVVDRGTRVPVLGKHGGNVGHKIGDDFLKLGGGLFIRRTHCVFLMAVYIDLNESI